MNRDPRGLAWLAALGMAAAVSAGAAAVAADSPRAPTARRATNAPWGRCTGPAILTAGKPVAGWRLGAIHFLSPEVGVGLTAARIPCVSHAWAGGIEVGFERQNVLVAVTEDGGRRWLAGGKWTVQPAPGPVVALAVTRRALWALGCPHRMNVQCRPVLARKLLRSRRWRRVADPAWMGRPCQVADLAAAGRADRWLLCLGNAAAGASTKGLLRTTDGDRTWTIASQVTSLTAPPRLGAITRGEPAALAAGSRTRLWLASFNGLYASQDAGATWRWVRGVNPHGMPSAFDVLSATTAWLLAPGQGLWRTTDGRHWRWL